MDHPALKKQMTISTVRRVSRIWSIVSIALIVLFYTLEGFDPAGKTLNDWIGLAFFPFGVVLGLVIGWRNEILGGAITTASLAGFYLIHGLILNGTFPKGLAFLLFSFPGICFLMIGLDSRE